MNHAISKADEAFKFDVEQCRISVQQFDHRAHIRLAYIYLVENCTDKAIACMRASLNGLLISLGIDPTNKYHETLTKAWVLAVHHFMNKTKRSESSADFIDQHPIMLDSKIMLTHYSPDLLFSNEARYAFIEPNLSDIPRYNV